MEMMNKPNSMKRYLGMATLVLSFFLSLFLNAGLFAQETLQGAWLDDRGDNTIQLLFQDGYFTETHYTPAAFVLTRGGPYEAIENTLSIKLEFDSKTPDRVGQTEDALIEIKEGALFLTRGGETLRLQRIDAGAAPLAGVWHITQRMQDGELVPIHRSGTRKTLKILTGTRFQWFAIDPANNMFGGTGGGRYEFKDGTYTEHIEFFSRDNTRVGSSLEFEGKLQGGDWHHQGLSSKGQPIYEVWSKVGQ